MLPLVYGHVVFTQLNVFVSTMVHLVSVYID
jgi:hypothetical protein